MSGPRSEDDPRRPPSTTPNEAIGSDDSMPSGYSGGRCVLRTYAVPIELLGRESFTWRFWRAPSWALAVVTGGLVAAGMTLGLVENLRDGSGGLGMMVFFGLILLVIWVTVLDALVGRTRGDASGLHVRTLFGSAIPGSGGRRLVSCVQEARDQQRGGGLGVPR